MKKLVTNLLLFTIPVLLWSIFANDVLPITTWTYRTWEAIRVKDSYLPISFGSIYPNYKGRMTEQGDLAHHTEYSIAKNVVWQTDELGFRNAPETKDTLIDIMLIGDSFIAGCGLDQTETLSEQLKALSGKNVYQMAPCGFIEFKKLLHYKLMPKPKMVVYSIIERNLNLLEPLSTYRINKSDDQKIKFSKHPFIRNFSILIDRMEKNSSYQYIKARLKGKTGTGVQSTVNMKFFFYEGKNQLPASKLDYNKVLESIQSYKSFCDSLGIPFVFLPCPDKESVYFEYVPFNKQPATLFKLDSLLCMNNIKTINSLDIFNKNKQYSLLYQYDDTHWNAVGVSLIAGEILKKYIKTVSDRTKG